MTNQARFGISSEGSFRFHSAKSAETARKQAIKSLKAAVKRNPTQFSEQLARYELAEIIECSIVG